MNCEWHSRLFTMGECQAVKWFGSGDFLSEFAEPIFHGFACFGQLFWSTVKDQSALMHKQNPIGYRLHFLKDVGRHKNGLFAAKLTN